MSYTDLVIDLETLGLTPGSVILEIGAVLFNRDSTKEGKKFSKTVDIQSCLDIGMTVDGTTLEWWLRRGYAPLHAVSIQAALQEFVTVLPNPHALLVWGHGSYFDVSLIEAAFQKCKIPVPWKFWNVRDTRTLFDVAAYHFNSPGNHSALEDAEAEAKAIILAVSKIQAWKNAKQEAPF